MNQFIYVLKLTRLGLLTEGPTEAEGAVLQAHFEYLQSMLAEKKAVLFGRTQTTDESTFGIVIFRAENQQQAEAFMQNDPTVKEGVMSATLFPYQIAGIQAEQI